MNKNTKKVTQPGCAKAKADAVPRNGAAHGVAMERRNALLGCSPASLTNPNITGSTHGMARPSPCIIPLAEEGINLSKLHGTFLSEAVSKSVLKNLEALSSKPDRFCIGRQE